MLNIDHYYELLGLKPGASEEEIRKAYRDLSRVWDSDRFINKPDLQQKAREKIKEIEEAYEKLMLYLLKSSEQPSQSEKNTTQTPEEESNFSYTQSSPLSSPTATLTDEDYAAFVGKNADKYINKFKKFNTGGIDSFVATWHWPVFFAGFWWMLYRKLYLWALLYFVLLLIPYVDVVACIAFAITSNYIYYKHSKNKLLEIKQAQQSPRMQKDVVVRTGGVNSWVVTVVVGVAVIGILAAIMIPAYLGMQARARKSQAQTEVQKGETFMDKESYHEAIDAFSKAIELSPKDAVASYAYSSRGLAYMFSQDFKHAVEDFTKAMEITPQVSDFCYYNRGYSYFMLLNYQQAIRDFDRAIELDYKHPEAYYYRGLSYSMLYNLPQAIRDFDRVIELNYKPSEAYYYRGLSYGTLGNDKQAIVDLTNAARLGNKKAQDFLNSEGIVW